MDKQHVPEASFAREIRMSETLGVASSRRQHRSTWRPVLSLELKAACARYGINVDTELWAAVGRAALQERED